MAAYKCSLCARKCGVERSESTTENGTYGMCSVGTNPVIARAALHFWEEPCISGTGGSGAVFFSGCPLRCVFCQNSDISRGKNGREVTAERLTEIYNELIWQGADNINLVTPTHYTRAIYDSLDGIKLPVPVVYNTGGYDSVEQLKMLEGKIQIYMPDFKYASPVAAKKYSGAADYPEAAENAIREMYRQRGKPVFDEDGMLLSGVIVRHLMLPGETENTFDVIDRITSMFPHGEVLFSLMSQYTPPEKKLKYENLNRRLTAGEYEKAVDYMYLSGIEDGYVQELSSAEREYTPPFDCTGV